MSGYWGKDCEVKFLSTTSNRIEELEKCFAVAVQALESISKNGCCGTCQEAKLVALSALRELGLAVDQSRSLI